jgi:VanZ family protein
VRRARIAAALWGGFLFLITSWPNPPALRAGGFPFDKLTHFLLYAVEAFLLSRAIAWPGKRGPAASRVLTVVGILALWGALDEAHQEWIPGRMMDAADLAADVFGATVGSLAAAATERRQRPESGRPR